MRLLKENIEMVGFKDAECINSDFLQALRLLKGQQFDVIFVDPPYQAGYYDEVLHALENGGPVTQATVVCLEHHTGISVQPSDAWQILQQKAYGDTALTFLRLRDRGDS